MVKTLGHRIMFLFHFIIITLLSPVIANVEKAIFTAPEAITIPLQKPSLEDLNLSVLTHDDSSIRANLTRVFPNEPKNYATGAATWLLLDSLNAGQRYELRVCWAAIVSSSMETVVFEKYLTRLASNLQASSWMFMNWTLCGILRNSYNHLPTTHTHSNLSQEAIPILNPRDNLPRARKNVPLHCYYFKSVPRLITSPTMRPS